jgi:hypothetical protein
MGRYRNANRALDAAWSEEREAALEGALEGVALEGTGTEKRELIYAAVRAQLASDNKRPWSLSQKLNDTPYRYTRDSLRAALNQISSRLAAAQPAVEFGVGAQFVNTQLGKTVSALINGIVAASRWRAQ